MSRVAGGLREAVHAANMALYRSGLVVETFGNVSAVDRAAGLFLIKPSGVPYDELTPAHMVPISLADGRVMDSSLRPSSDTPTHLELYRAFDCGGIAHTHSPYATVFAQARKPLPCLGTTHADYFHGDVPVTRPLRQEEVDGGYEVNTGRVIAETFRRLSLAAATMPAVLVANHGSFTWGKDAAEAVATSRALEYVAQMAWLTLALDPGIAPPERYLIDKHFSRKHGKDAYYGQEPT